MHKKKSYALIVLIILIFAAAEYAINRDRDEQTVLPTLERMVTTVSLQKQTVEQTIIGYGQTVSPKSASVAAESSGVITAINFKPGQVVKRGDALFDLRTNNISKQLKTLKAQAAASNDHYQRLSESYKAYKGSVSEYELHQAKFKAAQDAAAYKQASRIAHVISPIDGIVSDTDLTIGSSVSESQELVHVIDEQSLQVKYQLDSQYAKQVQIGQKIKFFVESETKPYLGQVRYVAPLLNAKDYNLTIRATLSTPQKLKPNTFGRVAHIFAPNHLTLVVPQSLVQADAKGFFVYYVDPQQKIAKQYFQPGNIDASGIIEVRSGLNDKLAIVSSNPENFSVNQKVKVKQS